MKALTEIAVHHGANAGTRSAAIAIGLKQMLLERKTCKCGIRFTPDDEKQTRCADCQDAPKNAQESNSWAVPDANGERVEASEYW